MTLTREVKWTDHGKALKISLIPFLILMIIVWITSGEADGDLDWKYVLYVIIFLQLYDLYRWTIWKLAGGYKE